jgi:hypothetical protein
MNSIPKNYKIIVDSKHFRNMKGIRPAEVAKKAAGKILGLSNRIIQFSMIETKNGKIRNYKAFKENLIRPYKKNGKLITCRIIVKKIGKHTGGGEAESLSEIYKKPKFTKEDIETIKAAMFVENIFMDESKTNYEPYNLTEINKILITQGNEAGWKSSDFLKLGENDPILQFFPIPEFEIGFDLSDDGDGKMVLRYKNSRYFYIIYEFIGDEDSFKLHIYNLSSCSSLWDFEGFKLIRKWEDYIEFLKKLYPEADISICYYKDTPNSNSNRNKLEMRNVSNFMNIFQNSNQLSNGLHSNENN